MQNPLAKLQASNIYQIATPALRILGVSGPKWRRNVASGSRIGPWMQGKYLVINEEAWRNKEACLYLVSGSDGELRYAGISRNGLSHRWRTSPAYDEHTMRLLPQKQIFHSQCWKHLERESVARPGLTFEVRVVTARQLENKAHLLGEQVKTLVQAFSGDGESIVAGVERWLCNNNGPDFLAWNTAMTRK